ncbi:hypothetical protein Bca4012_065641 [Brassica carinata]
MDLECKVRGRSVDPLVDSLVELVASCFRFKEKMFKGGLTASDIARMRSQKQKEKVSKEKNDMDNSGDSTEVDTLDQNASNTIANMVSTQLKDEISSIVDRVSSVVDFQVKDAILGLNLDQRINRLETEMNPILGMETRIFSLVSDKISKMQDAVINSVCDRLHNSVPANQHDLNQHDTGKVTKQQDRTDFHRSTVADSSPIQGITNNVDPGAAIRKYTVMARSKSSLMAGVGTYHFRPLPLPSVVNIECPAVAANPIQCRLLNASEAPNTVLLNAKPLEYVLPVSKTAAPPIKPRKSKSPRVTPAGLDDFKCDPTVVGGLIFMTDLERHYLEVLEKVTGMTSINIGRDHSVSTFDFLDIALRSTQMTPKVMDSLMAFINSQTSKTENMLLVSDTNLPATLMSHHSSKGKTSAPVKAFTFTRCKGIPQTSGPIDAAVINVLLIGAHKEGRLDACKTITPRVLPGDAKQLVVKFFRYLMHGDPNESGKCSLHKFSRNKLMWELIPVLDDKLYSTIYGNTCLRLN